MGLFAKLFRRKSVSDRSNIPNEYKMAIACNQEFEELMTADKYIKHCLIIASKPMYRKQKSISFFVFMKISLT